MQTARKVVFAMVASMGVLGFPGGVETVAAKSGQVNPRSSMPLTGESKQESWLDTPEGAEASEIMQKALKGEIDDKEFARLKAEWRAKWIEGKPSPSEVPLMQVK